MKNLGTSLICRASALSIRLFVVLGVVFFVNTGAYGMTQGLYQSGNTMGQGEASVQYSSVEQGSAASEIKTNHHIEGMKVRPKLVQGLNLAGQQETKEYMHNDAFAGKSIALKAYNELQAPHQVKEKTFVLIQREAWYGPKEEIISSYYREDVNIIENNGRILRNEVVEITEAFSEDGKTKVVDTRHSKILYAIEGTEKYPLSNQFEYSSKKFENSETVVTDDYKRNTEYGPSGLPKEINVTTKYGEALQIVYPSEGLNEPAAADLTMLPIDEFAKIANVYDALIKREKSVRLAEVENTAFPKLSVYMSYQLKHLL